MKRARLIVKEITLTQSGEVNFFTIRLPKNAVRIIGVETDAMILSPYAFAVRPSAKISVPDPRGTLHGGVLGGSGGIVEKKNPPFLTWLPDLVAVMGKLKLQTLDRIGIFFETRIRLLPIDGGIADMSYGLFPKSPYTLNQYTVPKKMNLLCRYSVIQGFFEDELGKRLNRNMTYTIKIFVWLETNEESKGLRFDFQTFTND
jgi:hypothetical protein